MQHRIRIIFGLWKLMLYILDFVKQVQKNVLTVKNVSVTIRNERKYEKADQCGTAFFEEIG